MIMRLRSTTPILHSANMVLKTAPLLLILTMPVLMSLAGLGRASELDLTPFFQTVETDPPSLEASLVVDLIGLTKAGWNVLPSVDRPVTLTLTLQRPIDVSYVEFELSFLSGEPGSFCGEAAFAALEVGQSGWTSLPINGVKSVGPEVVIVEPMRVQTKPPMNNRPDALITVNCPATRSPIRALRITFFPVYGGHTPKTRLGWMWNGNFCLTECRVLAGCRVTDNVAMDGPVAASHPADSTLNTKNVTDGMPASFCTARAEFDAVAQSYEVDLGAPRCLDHVRLLRLASSTPDTRWPDADSEVTLHAMPGGEPLWSRRMKPEDHPFSAEGYASLDLSEVERKMSGQYLRVMNANSCAPAHLLREIEAYEVTPLVLSSLVADGISLPVNGAEVPAGTRQINLAWHLPERIPAPEGKMRWKLVDTAMPWQEASIYQPVLLGALPPGLHSITAQWMHSDGAADHSTFLTAFHVLPQFWQTWWWWRLLLPAGVLGCALGLAVFVKRHTLQKAGAAREQQRILTEERTRIAMDMHDEVGARLSQLGLLQDLIHADSNSAPPGWKRLRDHTQEAIRSLDAVVWSVNPTNDTLTKTADYLTHMAHEYFAESGIGIQILFPNEWPTVALQATVRHHLMMTVREAFQNILKHSRAQRVSLSAVVNGGTALLTIEDDGQGFAPGVATGGDGLRNMQDRMDRIQGRMEIFSAPRAGTRVQLCFPVGMIKEVKP
jgi:signal transduction histidine kinase